jgi:hypothetical protein
MVAIASTVILAIMVALGVHVWMDSRVLSNGPLQVEGGWTIYSPVDVGQAQTFAQPEIDNTGTQDIILDSAQILPGTGSPYGLAVEEYLIGLPTRSNGGGASRGEPDPSIEGPWSAVAGTVIRPEHAAGVQPNGYSLIVVVRLNVIGQAWTNGVEIKYHIGSRHYIAKSDSRYVVCTPFTGRTLAQDHDCGDEIPAVDRY